MQEASFPFRISYCLVVLGIIAPFGLARSGWVALSTGPGLSGIVPFVTPVMLLLVGLYRIVLVARVRRTLDAPEMSGAPTLARWTGMFFVHAGAAATVASWLARPLMRSYVHVHTDDGIEYFVVGQYLALASGLGLWGLLLFEFSRLLGFEKTLAVRP